MSEKNQNQPNFLTGTVIDAAFKNVTIWGAAEKTENPRSTVYRSVEDTPGSPNSAYGGFNHNLTIDIVRDLAARGTGGAIY